MTKPSACPLAYRTAGRQGVSGRAVQGGPRNQRRMTLSRRCLNAAAAVLAAGLVTCAAAGAADADGSHPVRGDAGSGSEITAPGPDGPMSQQARDKVASTRAFMDALKRKDYAGAVHADAAYRDKWVGKDTARSPTSPTGATAAATAAASSRTLGVVQVGQAKNF